MPRYEGDPTRASATFEVFPKGDYEFSIGEPKAFERTNAKGAPTWGIRYTLTVQSEGPHKGKIFVQTLYKHVETAEGINKRFVMAAMGYQVKRDDEKRFDADFAGKDWSFDTDSGACGDAWRELTGRRVVASLDVKLGQDQTEQQDVKGWRPL
jgi:hypothetical protein